EKSSHTYVPQPTKSVATPLPPAVKGEVLAMLACGCAWLRSRFAPLTAVAASLPERCRLRRNAGLCLPRGMRGMEGERLLGDIDRLTCQNTSIPDMVCQSATSAFSSPHR